MSIANDIIAKRKRSSTGEIIVTLFEWCDLNCLFCNQDHNDVNGMEDIPDKITPIIECIEHLKTTKGKTEFTINIMGGEVFSDKVSDLIFDDYVKLVDSIEDYSQSNYIPIHISFVTNFVWKNKDRVKNFVENNNVRLYTSYDPSGRFNTATFETFCNNVEEFEPYTDAVNVIMTKQNIQSFMKGRIPFFDYLYDNFEIYFDYYTPEEHFKELVPTDTELRDFMIYMSDYWPDCLPFVNFKSKEKTKMTCMDTYTIMPDSSYGRCTSLLKDSLDNTMVVKLIPQKEELEQEWFDEYNCIECEHFNRCSLGCYLSNHIKNGRTQEECWLKQVYEHIDGLDNKTDRKMQLQMHIL